MSFLGSCRHGDYCDRCSKCESETGINNAIKEIEATGLEMIKVSDAVGIIKGCLEANEKRIKDRERKEDQRHYDEEFRRSVDALMVDDPMSEDEE